MFLNKSELIYSADSFKQQKERGKCVYEWVIN